MSVMVVGGDKIGTILENLRGYGFDDITHVTGRKKSDVAYDIPCNTDVVLILTDFVSHKMSKTMKKKGKETNTKVIFAKRSWPHIEQNIKTFLK